MEYTVSAVEKARIPTPEEAEMIDALSVGAVAVFMGQPVLADVDRIVVAVDWPTGALTCTLAAQPDCARNVTVALTDSNNSCTGTLTVLGLDPAGRVISETMTPLGTGVGKTLTGTKLFSKITSITVAGGAGGTPSTDTFTVGVGDKIGVPFDLTDSDEVVSVYLGGVRIASPTIVTGVKLSSIDVSSGTYDGSKLMFAYIRPTRNVPEV